MIEIERKEIFVNDEYQAIQDYVYIIPEGGKPHILTYLHLNGKIIVFDIYSKYTYEELQEIGTPVHTREEHIEMYNRIIESVEVL